MAQKKDVGVFQDKNGSWYYTFSLLIDGQRIRQRRFTDATGAKLSTKKEAIKAREAAIKQAYTDRSQEAKKHNPRRTVKEVFEEFQKSGRKDRAYQTIKKQDCIWKNHLLDRFGSRFVDDISSGEILDYLTELYYDNQYSYQYVESFLKMFYLIFGQAYSRNYLDVDIYNKLCVNKDTKIKMPKLKVDDDLDIVSFTEEELQKLDRYFKGTNVETAYLLGRYCGLRINECFGLKWENVNLEEGSIIIDRQMQYHEGIIKLVPPKTRNSNRTVYMNDILKVHFQKKKQQRDIDEVELAELREQNRRIITDLDGSKIPTTEMVNCLPDGKVQTMNSLKYHAREIKANLKIFFKFHFLRHTYGTKMAEMNTPEHLLSYQMGHGNSNVTRRYYIAISPNGVNTIQNNVNNL